MVSVHGSPGLCFKPLKLLNFDFIEWILIPLTYTNPASRSVVDPDPAF
jgi:hypothetical protein